MDFVNQTKSGPYEQLFDKIKDLDISILVNNVGMS